MSGNPKNKKTSSESSPDKLFEEKIEEERRRQLAAIAATVALWNSAEGNQAIIKSKRVEMVAEMEARRDASLEEADRVQKYRAERERNKPWGIHYLEQPRDQSTVETKVREKLANKAARLAIQEEKSEELPKIMSEARELTLSIGKEAAERLKAADVKPDTEIYWGKSQIKTSGLRSKNVHKSVEFPPDGKPQQSAWLIPIPGQVNSSARALLMEDGKILTALADFEAKGEHRKNNKDGPLKNNRIRIRPNVPPAKNKHHQQISHNHVYFKYVNEELESDLGMAIIPVSKNKDKDGNHLPTTTHGAHIVLEREAAMQEAIKTLVVKSEME